MNNTLKSNPAADRTHDLDRVGASERPLRTVPHVLGVLSLIWSLIAWAEWFLIPFLYPHDGSPVPYLGFAPQAILLLLGCVGVMILIPLLAIAMQRSKLLLYAVPAAALVVLQVGSFVLEIFL